MGLVILLSLSGSSWLCAQVTSELRAGKWIEVAAPATQVSTTQPTETMDPELNRIEELIREGNSKQANKAAIQWLKFNKGSQYYDRALFLEAEALFLYGDRIKSFYYLDELLDEYAESPLYFQALDRQYDIAEPVAQGSVTPRPPCCKRRRKRHRRQALEEASPRPANVRIMLTCNRERHQQARADGAGEEAPGRGQRIDPLAQHRPPSRVVAVRRRAAGLSLGRSDWPGSGI